MNSVENEFGSKKKSAGPFTKIVQRLVFVKELSGLIMLGVVVLIFTALSPAFLSLENLQVILEILPELGILAIGVTLLMISGEFDLSVGSVFAFAPILNGLLLNSKWNPFVAFILPMLACLGIGALNGIVRGAKRYHIFS